MMSYQKGGYRPNVGNSVGGGSSHSGSVGGGGGGSGRRSQKTISSGSVYEYALRCAIRACLEQTKGASSAAGNALLPGSQAGLPKDKESRHFADVLGSLSDRWDDTSGKGDKKADKLTREVVRALIRRMDDIKKGKDTSKAEYSEPRFVAVMAQMQKHVLQHRFRPSGTINDLCVVFVTVAKTNLQKTDDVVNRYLPLFAEIVKKTVVEDCPSAASNELLDRLHGYMGIGKPQRHPSDRQAAGSPATQAAYGSVESFEQFTMVKTVRILFQVDPNDHRRKLRELQPICTQSAFLHDLKKCINHVHTNDPFPCNSNDFGDRQSYEAWQKRELNQLTGLLKTLTLLDPNLSMAPSKDTDNSMGMSGFTFIPENPRGSFERLMNMCIDYDAQSISAAERAKTSVLSQQSDELLRECFRTWRLSTAFRAILYLKLIKERYDRGVFEYDDITDGLRSLERAIKETDVKSWTTADRTSLVWVYEGLERTFMRQFVEGLKEYWKISPLYIEESLTLIDRIYEDPVYLHGHPDSTAQFRDLDEIVEGAAVTRWRMLGQASNSPQADDLTNLFNMADKLTKELVSLATKKFKKPIKGVLSVPGIVMTIQMPYFALEIENWAYLPEARNAPIEVVFELYHKLLTLKRLYDQYGPQQKAALFKVESWFSLHVRRWLQTTDKSTPEWVDNAINQDQFIATNSATLHSSSIVDLFSLFHQAVDFVQKLQWPNQYQWCRFMTALSRIIAVALTQYTYALEDRITQDIYPHLARERTENIEHSFMDRARLQLMGNRPSMNDAVPDDFTPQMCVKINNIEAARSRLDRLYQTMDVDEIADYLKEHGGPAAAEKAEQKHYLYSIRVVRAENLAPQDSNGLSDPYVILEIDNAQVARTRTVYETLNPRWDQTFDLWLDNKTIDVMAIVFDEDLLKAHDECGSAMFRLSPKYFDDYQSHDIVLDLHPHGRLLLRVSMEGEKDDIQFWYGKTFRTLKRAENDAAGLIVDKMSRYVRHCLSRKVIDKLLGRDRSSTSFFSFGSSRAAAKEPVDLTLPDYEDAIAPLLDYLERNLHILNNHLSESNMQLVVLKIWREVLVALESVLLPPLSEHPSDMKPLDEYEFDVVYKWLELLKIFFNGGDDGDAVPLDKLENAQYYTLLAINVAYNMETHELMNTHQKAQMQQVEIKQKGGRKADRSKSVYHSKHTMRKRRGEGGKRTKKPEATAKPPAVMTSANIKAQAIDLPTAEVILRILRMRPGKDVRDFLRQEFDKRNNPAPPPPPPHAVALAEASKNTSPAPNASNGSLPLPPLPVPSTSSSSTSLAAQKPPVSSVSASVSSVPPVPKVAQAPPVPQLPPVPQHQKPMPPQPVQHEPMPSKPQQQAPKPAISQQQPPMPQKQPPKPSISQQPPPIPQPQQQQQQQQQQQAMPQQTLAQNPPMQQQQSSTPRQPSPPPQQAPSMQQPQQQRYQPQRQSQSQMDTQRQSSQSQMQPQRQSQPQLDSQRPSQSQMQPQRQSPSPLDSQRQSSQSQMQPQRQSQSQLDSQRPSQTQMQPQRQSQSQMQPQRQSQSQSQMQPQRQSQSQVQPQRQSPSPSPTQMQRPSQPQRQSPSPLPQSHSQSSFQMPQMPQQHQQTSVPSYKLQPQQPHQAPLPQSFVGPVPSSYKFQQGFQAPQQQQQQQQQHHQPYQQPHQVYPMQMPQMPQMPQMHRPTSHSSSMTMPQPNMPPNRSTTATVYQPGMPPPPPPPHHA